MSTSTWTHQPTSKGDRAGIRRRIDEQTELLGRASLFQGLSKRQLREIAKVSAARRVAADQELVKEGAAGTVCFLILDGAAKVVRGGRTVKQLGPGDFFGEMSLLTRAPRTASVIARTPMECITLSAAGLKKVLLDNPQITLSMLSTLADRIAELDRKVY
jgi:CRP/FNR family transcriptional regulator, cyclic AMP receptor protein